MKVSVLVFLLSFSFHAHSQSLIEALGAFPQLSQFRDLLNEHPLYLESVGNASIPISILASTNQAFLDYETTTGTSIHSLDDKVVVDTLFYQTFNRTVQPSDYSTPDGYIAETWLTDPDYNLRKPLSSGGAPGQVAWLSSTNTSLTVRQLASGFVQSGTGTQIEIVPITGKWSGGTFFAADGFLTLPLTCTATFDVKGLYSLQTSLTRTNLSDTLNSFPDVVCLAPDNQAFLAAGSPDSKANISTLTSALLFHTIQGPGYSTDYHDGQILTSASNDSILVTKQSDGTIYFNDAKVLALNQIVKNGVVHVLDKVMSPLSAVNTTNLNGTSSSSSASASGTGAASSASGSGSATATSGGSSSTSSTSGSGSPATSSGAAMAAFRLPLSEGDSTWLFSFLFGLWSFLGIL